MTHNIQILDQHFVLHPSGSMHWVEESILIISDVHLGKISHFRKFGAAVPQNAIQGNFELLNESVAYFNPKIIYFLGDLFHSHMNNEWRFFEQWTSNIKTDLVLITGNHDIISPLKYEELGIRLEDEIILKGILFTHHPEERTGCYNLCGHIHPAIKIRGNAKQSLRLPSFFKTKNQLILPAFGQFTGTHTLKPKKQDEVFAIAEGTIIKI